MMAFNGVWWTRLAAVVYFNRENEANATHPTAISFLLPIGRQLLSNRPTGRNEFNHEFIS